MRPCNSKKAVRSGVSSRRAAAPSVISRLKNKVLAATIMGALAFAPATARAEPELLKAPVAVANDSNAARNVVARDDVVVGSSEVAVANDLNAARNGVEASAAGNMDVGKKARRLFDLDFGSVTYFGKGSGEKQGEKFKLSRDQFFLRFEYPVYWRFRGFSELAVENTAFAYAGELVEGVRIDSELSSFKQPSVAQGLKFNFLDSAWVRLDGILRGEVMVGGGKLSVDRLVLSLGDLTLDLKDYASKHAPVAYSLKRFDVALQSAFKLGRFEPYLTVGLVFLDCTLNLQLDEESRKMVSMFGGEEGKKIVDKGISFSEKKPYGVLGLVFHVWKPAYLFVEGAVIPVEAGLVYEGMAGVKTRF